MEKYGTGLVLFHVVRGRKLVVGGDWRLVVRWLVHSATAEVEAEGRLVRCQWGGIAGRGTPPSEGELKTRNCPVVTDAVASALTTYQRPKECFEAARGRVDVFVIWHVSLHRCGAEHPRSLAGGFLAISPC